MSKIKKWHFKQSTVVTLGGILALYFSLMADSPIESVWIRHTGFHDFVEGTWGDGGANSYVSYKGRLQTINRWDLNGDGELDLLFTQDHNDVYAPDSLIYWGSKDGYQSLLPENWKLRAPFSLLKYLESASHRVTRLPTSGGGRGQIADLNLDGFPDIIFCNFMHNYRTDQPVYIYWGSTYGFRVTARTELPALLASGVAIGDLNQDGLPDIVVANRGDESGEAWGFRNHLESYIYWGNVNGYGANQRSSIRTISAADVSIGDFNGDRFLDLSFLNFNSQEKSAYIYWGNGGGEFSEHRRQILQSMDLQVSISSKVTTTFISGMNTLGTANLNGDRFTDLVVAGTEKALTFYGSPQGLDSRQSNALPVNNCAGVETADLNGDGHMDLIVANQGQRGESSPASAIFWGTSNGFNPKTQTILPTLAATTVQVADLNGDKFPDILFGNSRGPQGSDTPSYIYWGGPSGHQAHRRSELLGFGVAGSDIGDLNADGHPDVLLIGHLSGGKGVLPSSIFWGNSTHHYSTASMSLLEPGGEMEYSIADLDDDEHPDLVFIQEQALAVWWGSREGYSAKNRTHLPVESAISSSVADLNRDGFLDLLVTVAGSQNLFNLREGRPSKAIIVWGNQNRFQQTRTTEIELLAPAIQANTIADLNKDGYLDLIFPHRHAEFFEIRWGSSQGYQQAAVTNLEANGSPHIIVADLDQNGWLDIIATNSQTPSRRTTHTETYVYWGDAEGFSTSSRTSLEGFVSLDASVADFNHDGHLDFAMTNYQSDTERDLPVFIYWGDEEKNLAFKHRTFLHATSPSAIDALDLNRDGWVDLVVSNHQIDFDHAAGTNIYWGSSQGFSLSSHTHLPTFGVHLDAMVDAGNIYTRRYEWDYISKTIEAPENASFTRLHWIAETKFGTSVKFQVRSATTQENLEKEAWKGPTGKESFYELSGATLEFLHQKNQWLQYRAILTSPDGGNSAILTEVALQCNTKKTLTEPDR